MSLFVDLFNTLDSTLLEFREEAVTNLASYIRQFVFAAGVLTIIIAAAELQWGGIASIKKVFGAFFMIAIVSIFATNPENYNLYIGNYLAQLPDDFLQAISSAQFASTGGIGAYLDQTMNDMMTGIGRIWSSAGIMNGNGVFAPILLAVVLFVLLLLMGAAAMISIIVGKVGIALVAGLGPLFMMTLVVPGLKELFTRWISYAISMAILQLLIGGVLLIAKTILETYATALTDPNSPVMNSPGGVMAPALIMLVLTYIFGQLPNMASSLAGGIGISTGNAAWTGVSAASAGIAAGSGAVAGAIGRGFNKLANAGSNFGGGSSNSVRQGGANSAYQRLQIQRGRETQAQKDAPQTPARRTSESAKALARLQEEAKRQNNKEDRT